jgi:RNA recognition motif-containing protein
MGTKLYVGNLPFSVNNDALKDMFAAHGNVVSARIIMDKVSGRSKGFGFVEFDSDDSANTAMNALNSSEIEGRKIIVNEAKPPSEGGGHRGGGGGGYGGGGGGGGRRHGGGGGGGGYGGGGGGRDRGPRY